MGYHTDELELASPFQPLEGEANFGPTLTREVVGGAHLAPHVIMTDGSRLAMITWEQGLPRHDQPGTKATRFPHGLMLFGESFEECAARLAKAQAGVTIDLTRVVHVYSYLDDVNHWHMEPIVVARVDQTGNLPDGVVDLEWFDGAAFPSHGVWRGKPPFSHAYDNFIEPVLPQFKN